MYPKASYSKEALKIHNPLHYQTFPETCHIHPPSQVTVQKVPNCGIQKGLQGIVILGIISIITFNDLVIRVSVGLPLILIELYLLLRVPV